MSWDWKTKPWYWFLGIFLPSGMTKATIAPVDFEVSENHCHKAIHKSSWAISLQQAQWLLIREQGRYCQERKAVTVEAGDEPPAAAPLWKVLSWVLDNIPLPLVMNSSADITHCLSSFISNLNIEHFSLSCAIIDLPFTVNTYHLFLGFSISTYLCVSVYIILFTFTSTNQWFSFPGS